MMIQIKFKNREEAGKRLAKRLENYAKEDVVVYALPRGGVVVGAEVARALHAPLDILTARKIGHPDFPEFAIAAVGQNGYVVKNKEAASAIGEDRFDEVDDFICLYPDPNFVAIGTYYEEFSQVSDKTVIKLLRSVNMKAIKVKIRK